MSDFTLNSDIKNVLKSAPGRRVIWQILSMCRLYTDNYGDVNMMMYNSGRRGVGIEILAMLEDADPTNYARLIIDQGADNGNDSTAG